MRSLLTKSNNFRDLTYQKFGKWLVINRGENGTNNRVRWICECECGRKQLIYSSNLTTGNTSRCRFCLNITHGKTDKPIHNSWRGMVERCTNPKSKYYKYYGGRGINICERWKIFENFFEDMGDIPLAMTLDRIDVNQGYFKENCRFITQKEQMKNRRISIHTGDICNDWVILKKSEEYKKYDIKCLNCNRQRIVQGSHFKTLKICNCIKGN